MAQKLSSQPALLCWACTEVRQGFPSSAGKVKSTFGAKQEIPSKPEGRLLSELVGMPVLTQRQDSIQGDELSDVQEGWHGLYGNLTQSRPQVAVLT